MHLDVLGGIQRKDPRVTEVVETLRLKLCKEATGGGNKDDDLKFLACVGSSNQNRTSMGEGKGSRRAGSKVHKERKTDNDFYI